MRPTSEERLEVQDDSLSIEPATVPPSEGEDCLEDPQEPSLVPPVPTAPRTKWLPSETQAALRVDLIACY